VSALKSAARKIEKTLTPSIFILDKKKASELFEV